MANIVRIRIGLKCQESGDINYTTWKNLRTHTEEFEVKKYYPRSKEHTTHKEVRLKS